MDVWEPQDSHSYKETEQCFSLATWGFEPRLHRRAQRAGGDATGPALGCLWGEPGSKRAFLEAGGVGLQVPGAARPQAVPERRGSGEGRSSGGGGAEALGAGRRRTLARWLAMPGPAAREEEGSGGEGAAPGAARRSPGARPGRGAGAAVRLPAKLSGKGPLRGYRNRWFVFDARRCYLYYFKSAGRAAPRPPGHRRRLLQLLGPRRGGRARLAEPPAHFQVHSAGAVTVLKVGPRPCSPAPASRGRAHALLRFPLLSLGAAPVPSLA